MMWNSPLGGALLVAMRDVALTPIKKNQIFEISTLLLRRHVRCARCEGAASFGDQNLNGHWPFSIFFFFFLLLRRFQMVTRCLVDQPRPRVNKKQ